MRRQNNPRRHPFYQPLFRWLYQNAYAIMIGAFCLSGLLWRVSHRPDKFFVECSDQNTFLGNAAANIFRKSYPSDADLCTDPEGTKLKQQNRFYTPIFRNVALKAEKDLVMNDTTFTLTFNAATSDRHCIIKRKQSC